MASKTQTKKQTVSSPITPSDSTTHSPGPAHLPPTISPSSKLLSSIISLPNDCCIFYSVFSPPGHLSQHYQYLEDARRHVLNSTDSSNVLNCVLPRVYVTKDSASLYLFVICGKDGCRSQERLGSFSFDGLTQTEQSRFSSYDLYPCSTACSTEPTPCSTCLSTSHPTQSSSTARLFPRVPLRRPYTLLLEVVRERLINNICESSKLGGPSRRPVKRLKGGFLVGSPPPTSEWSANWEHHAQTRPLVCCHLQIDMSPTHFTIHPILRSTCYLPLRVSLPVPAGTPITLLPYGTPAYFLTSYRGPTSALTAQFEQSLTGLGAGEWKANYPSLERPPSSTDRPASEEGPAYVIAWISVQNKQGEDKGLTVIWPTRLCTSFLPSSSELKARPPLPYIPELPAQLQSSPSPPSHVPSPVSPNIDKQPVIALAVLPDRPMFLRAHTSTSARDSLNAFRALTINKTQNVKRVADDVGRYVDIVAKEREKERERLRKEREIAASPKSGAATTSTSAVKASATTPAPVVVTPGTPPADLNNPADSAPVRDDGQATQQQHLEPSPLPTQQFYPSPANSDATAIPVASDNAANVHVSPSIAYTSNPPPPPAMAIVSAPATSFDPFANMDASWSQPTSEFMSMGMDYGMGFSMDIDTIGGGGGGTGGGDNMGMDFEDGYGVFTEDDFDFFDRPAAGRSVAPPPGQEHGRSISAGTGLSPAGPAPLGLSPPLFGDSTHLPGPGPSSAVTQLSPWMSTALAGGFSPANHAIDGGPVAPDLIPSSPTQTPSSHSEPATPTATVEFAHTMNITHGKSSAFDPIPFAPRHRIADGKYVMGKFALPSPPHEEDLPFLPSSAPVTPSGWKHRYSAVTDPRVGMVQKLIGVKRKSFDQGVREIKVQPTWVRNKEEWESVVVCREDEMDLNKSDPESEDEEPWIEEDVPVLTRPSTPPPSYLPLGPTLLYTHFHHSQLLPISSSLRPPGAAVDPTNMAAATVSASVPTPVSPAAALGAAMERSKSHEAAAQILAREIVENSLWADAWLTTAAGMRTSQKSSSEVWQVDAQTVAQVMGRVPELQGPLDCFSLLGGTSKNFEPIQPPMLTVGKSDTLLRVLPPALRFWEKLGLGPRGGSKDVTAFVVYEGETEDRQEQAATWLKSVTLGYTARNYGLHVAGRSNMAKVDGLVPLQFDSLRKTLSSFLSALPVDGSRVVIYIVTPLAIMSLASPTLRQVFSVIKRATKASVNGQLIFELVPEQHVFAPIQDPSLRHSGLEPLVCSVYDRILQPVDRLMARSFSEQNEEIRSYFEEPAFTLARPLHSKIKLLRQAPVGSLDVVDRYTLLHVGYALSACGNWLFAACVDERGEAHDLAVWLTQNEGREAHVVKQVWAFIVQFAKRGNVEWRIAIAKLGLMGEQELNVWFAHLETAVPVCRELPMIHVSLLAVDQDSPWTFLAPPSDSNKDKHVQTSSFPWTSNKEPKGTFFCDTSSTTYIISHSTPLTTPSPSSGAGAGNAGTDQYPYVPDGDEDGAMPRDELGVRPLRTTLLIHVPSHTDFASIATLQVHLLHTVKSSFSSLDAPDAETHQDITRNFHELAVLAQARWRMNTAHPVLPFHLAALDVMRAALDRWDVGSD